MYNNPQNLAPDEFLGQAQRPEDVCYLQFAAVERGTCGLMHTIYRIVWDRKGTPEILRDFSWFHYESPPWVRGVDS